ncbi:hypothetical protein ACB322_30200, partial [Klebsiella pneumoniae]
LDLGCSSGKRSLVHFTKHQKRTLTMKDEIRHEKPVEVNIQLTHREAQALAQLVKRLGFSDCRGLATSDIEAYLMMDGINQIMKALAEEGYAPR